MEIALRQSRRQRQKYFAHSILERWRWFCGVFQTFGGCIKVMAKKLESKVVKRRHVVQWCLMPIVKDKDRRRLLNRDCLKCSECIAVCSHGALSWPKPH